MDLMIQPARGDFFKKFYQCIGYICSVQILIKINVERNTGCNFRVWTGRGKGDIINIFAHF